MITTDLLEALLSPDLSRRQTAESHFATLEVHSRIEGLIRHVVQQISTVPGEKNASSEAVTQHLAAVLLRQDILQLTQVSELQELVSRLLSSTTTIGHNHPRTRGIHDCLAQICSSLQMLDMAVAVDTVTAILKVSRSMDITSTKLSQLEEEEKHTF